MIFKIEYHYDFKIFEDENRCDLNDEEYCIVQYYNCTMNTIHDVYLGNHLGNSILYSNLNKASKIQS